MARIIYIHVPKCGGSSFGAALRLRYAFSQAAISLNQGKRGLTGEAYILNDYAARSYELQRHVHARTRLIVGHVQYDRDLHNGAAKDYRFVTMLRDPVDRFVSHYNYLQRHHPNPDRPSTLKAFLDTDDARRLASQYLFYFAGQSQTQTRDTRLLIEHAISNLARFDLIGDLSNPRAFGRDLAGLTGTPLPVLRRNQAPRQTHVPKHLRGRIEAICAPDIAIYNACHAQRAIA